MRFFFCFVFFASETWLRGGGAVLLEWQVAALSYSGQIKPLSLSVVVQGDDAPRCFTIAALSIDAMREFANAAAFPPTAAIKYEPFLEEEEEDGGVKRSTVRVTGVFIRSLSRLHPFLNGLNGPPPTPFHRLLLLSQATAYSAIVSPLKHTYTPNA